MVAGSGNRKVVVAALLGNAAVAATKFGAAVFTGSSAMLSEGVHSLVDTSNQLLMLYGMRRASRPPDPCHPFGHGRELYFWSFIVALMVFALGAGVSFYEGVRHLRHPSEMESAWANYAVIGASLVFEGASWWISYRSFGAEKGRRGWFAAFRESKDPTTFTVLFEDSAAMLGLLVAFAGVALSQATGDPRYDGYASIGIAVILAIAAALLARETKQLLLGESAQAVVYTDILRIAAEDPDVRHANGVVTEQLGPHTIVAALSAEFDDALTAPRIEACILRIEDRVREMHPGIVALFVKPQTAETWESRIARLQYDDGEEQDGRAQ